MYTSIGLLRYNDGENKVYMECPSQIVDYYRSLVPKEIELNKTRFAPHVTVVRKEVIIKRDEWRKYDGCECSFEYSPIIGNNETYWWLPVTSKQLEVLREGLGLIGCPPWHNGFHLTIGNTKGR